ncbi:MAG: aminotransferase class V-fold PLP-dependent enzyme [Acidobacteriota bacterium]
MNSQPSIRFKIATEDWEFEQIHRLNYKTFVEEIPQHGQNHEGILIDRFHDENTYIIAVNGNAVVGMIAVRDRHPFSLEQKLENLESYLPPNRSICEFRLLALDKSYRSSRVMGGLVQTLAEYCLSRGYDLAIISGITNQTKMYKHAGFEPFGPLVGTPGAQFQPMYLTLEAFNEFRKKSRLFSRTLALPGKVPTKVNLLPGPVAIGQNVRQVFSEEPVSHRSRVFIEDFQRTKKLLCDLVGARYVEIFTGSGTLANDIIAAQLSLQAGKGFIASNGEFGSRLIDHATRFRLPFVTYQFNWGEPFDYERIGIIIDENSGIEWMWVVHCETSTGILNDMASLKKLCIERRIKLCLDCISSIGTIPVDLRGVYLASGVSGKALGAFPGLSMVFCNHEIPPAPKSLPRYLDLGLYAASEGIPFTISSNLLYALKAALESFLTWTRFQHIIYLSNWLKFELRKRGLQILADDAHSSPAVLTIILPQTVSSRNVGDQLAASGYLLNYMSEYLLKRNWIQICLMGECSKELLEPLLNVLPRFCYPDRWRS